MALGDATGWTLTDFVWQNPAIPEGSTVQWYVKYCDATGNCSTTDTGSFGVERPTSVTLTSFTATPRARLVGRLWDLVVRLGNLGFSFGRALH